MDTKRTSSTRDWIPITAILLTVIGISALFLTPSYKEFPMDDTYIHLVYAENLAETGKLYFSFPEEIGVGATSILWVLLLAAGHGLGISTYFAAKFLGIASLAVVAVGVYLLLRERIGRSLAFFTVFLAVTVGNLAWFSLSGMETMLFLAIGILALLAYKYDQWGWMGIFLGLLILTRPEGLLLAFSIFLIELAHRRQINRTLILAMSITGLIAAPWFIYLFIRTGLFLPTSGVGKHLAHDFAISYILDRNPILPGLEKLPFLMYIGAWMAFLLGFTFGGMSLPAPSLSLGPFNGIPEFSISIWAPLIWITITGLLVHTARRSFTINLWPKWLREHTQRPLLILIVWTVLHNLLFMVYMPIPGTASRYGAINHIFIWVAIGFGIHLLSVHQRQQVSIVLLLGAFSLVNMSYWDSVYSANIEHMEEVRIQSAQYLRDTFPDNVICAAYDIGAVRYHSELPILAGALIDPEAAEYFINGQLDRYLLENNAQCLVIPGRSGSADEGWFDLIEIFDLNNHELIFIEPVAEFEISYDRWLLGYLPTNNYQASVNIYNVRVNEASTYFQSRALQNSENAQP